MYSVLVFRLLPSMVGCGALRKNFSNNWQEDTWQKRTTNTNNTGTNLFIIFQFLAKNIKALGSEGQKTIGELQQILGGVGGMKNLLLSITEEEPVEKAFEIMKNYNVHGVPVLGKDGKLVGHISVSDLLLCCCRSKSLVYS